MKARNSIIGAAALGLAAVTGCGVNDIGIEGTAAYCVREPVEPGKTTMGIYVDVSITLSKCDGCSGPSLVSAALSVKGGDISAVIFSKSYGEHAPNPAAYTLREPSVELPGAVDYAEVIASGRHVVSPGYLPLEQVDCATLDAMLSQ